MGNGMSGIDMGGGGGSVNTVSATDIWSYRHRQGNEPFVDAINSGMRALDNDFPGFTSGINRVDAVVMSGRDKYDTLGYWSPGDKQLGINQNYTDINKMNGVMDTAARKKFHPPRGNKTGTEAVALHEGGHALTDYIAQQTGAKGLHEVSKKIVKDAYKNSGARGGVRIFAGKISKYAKKNYAECVAEAVADWYCNGNKSSASSKAIMSELKKYS